jgi:hypothetical protein
MVSMVPSIFPGWPPCLRFGVPKLAWRGDAQAEVLDMDEVLARSGIFQGVDPEAAESLVKDLETVEARKGEVIFNEGEPGDSLYIILSGKIKLGGRRVVAVRPRPAYRHRHRGHRRPAVPAP